MPSREFRVSTEMGNEAMQSSEDVANALVAIAADLRSGGFARHAQNVYDHNGNRVGMYKLYVREV